MAFYDGVVTGGQNPAAAAASDHLLVQGADRVSVTVQADRVARVTAAMTAKLGFQLQTSRADLHFAEGTLPIKRLRSVGKLVTKVGRYMVLPTFAPITSASALDMTMPSSGIVMTRPWASRRRFRSEPRGMPVTASLRE